MVKGSILSKKSGKAFLLIRILFMTGTGVILLTNSYAIPDISIYPVKPTGYLVHYEDLWNVNIVASPVDPAAYYFLEAEVSDDRSLPLWKARSYTFKTLSSPRWISSFDMSDLEPVSIIFSDGLWYEKMTAGGGLFPPGNYKITYRLVQTTAGCTTAGKLSASASYLITIRAMFPPTLLFPFDKDTLAAEPAVFTWVPPFPVYAGQKITYELRINEVLWTQQPSPALTSGPSFFTAGGIEFTQYVYPAGARPLTAGIRYAWQVIAYSDQSIAGYSPVWTFVVGEKFPAPPVSAESSVRMPLSANPGAPFYDISTGILSFRYDEPYNDEDALLSYTVVDESGNTPVLSGNAKPLYVDKGYNVFGIDISRLNEGKYSLIVNDEKNRKSYLRFRIQKSATQR